MLSTTGFWFGKYSHEIVVYVDKAFCHRANGENPVLVDVREKEFEG